MAHEHRVCSLTLEKLIKQASNFHSYFLAVGLDMLRKIHSETFDALECLFLKVKIHTKLLLLVLQYLCIIMMVLLLHDEGRREAV